MLECTGCGDMIAEGDEAEDIQEMLPAGCGVICPSCVIEFCGDDDDYDDDED